MGFIEWLQKSQNKEVILVAVDRLIKYGHFIALSHPILLKEWLKYSWNTFINSLAYPKTLYQTVIKYSSTSFGEKFSNS